MKEQVLQHYGLEVTGISPIIAGVGGLTYRIDTTDGKYILKGVREDGYVRNEPEIAAYLKEQEFPVADYIRAKDGQYLWLCNGYVYHLQRFVEGEIIPFHEAPDWFMTESPQMLGRIHASLSRFRRLPVGMGESFLKFMLSDQPKASYLRTKERAESLHDEDILADVNYRLTLVDKLRDLEFDLSRFTCLNTHGDYKISQIICKDERIAAVIDWTSACTHPVCWEIIRSFTYAEPSCRSGEINADSLIAYIKAYLEYHPLNQYDLRMMPYYFYHQILACDYYGQYYNSADVNREDFLFQAKFATKLIRWLEGNVENLARRLAFI